MFAALGRLSISHLAAAQALAVGLCTRLLLLPEVLHARIQEPFGAAPDLLHALRQPGVLVLPAEQSVPSASGLGHGHSSHCALDGAAMADEHKSQEDRSSLKDLCLTSAQQGSHPGGSAQRAQQPVRAPRQEAGHT